MRVSCDVNELQLMGGIVLDATKLSAHVVVEGRVQGVFFRDATRRLALALDVVGWVRNLPDGRVEALFEGDAGSVKKMLEFVNRGPARAVVEHVGVEYRDAGGEFSDFRIEGI